jgi:hypothetical protein
VITDTNNEMTGDDDSRHKFVADRIFTIDLEASKEWGRRAYEEIPQREGDRPPNMLEYQGACPRQPQFIRKLAATRRESWIHAGRLSSSFPQF